MDDLGDKVRALREEKGLSRKAFGEMLAVPEGKVQKIEIGAQRADHEFLSALANRTGADMNWLLRGHGIAAEPLTGEVSDFIPIPRYSIQAALGFGAAVPEVEAIQGWHPFRRDYLARRGLNPKRLSVIIGKGDSMTPDIHDGDPVLINHDDTTPRDGLIYAIRMGDDLSLKRVLRLPDGLQLISTNKVYPPITLTAAQMETAAVIARVVSSSHDW